MRKRTAAAVGLAMAAAGWAAGGETGGGVDWKFWERHADNMDLADVSKATYAEARAPRPRIESPLPYEWDSAGNAWLLSETAGEGGGVDRCVVAFDGTRVVELARDREWDRGKNPWTEGGGWGPEYAGWWTSGGNPAADARRAVRLLHSPEWRGGEGHESEIAGRLFFLAWALRQRGDEAGAAELVAALEERAGGAEAVAAAATDLAIEGHYGNLYDKFRETGDWAELQSGLQGILAWYWEGWLGEPGGQLLLERIEKRAADPAPPPAGGEQLTADERGLADGMMDIRALRSNAGSYGRPAALWLAPSSWLERAPKPLDAELEIRARGLAAIPFLLKLADDDALVPADRAEVAGERWRYGRTWLPHRGGSSALKDRQRMAEAIFDQMDRPATRGEVARRLLADLAPEGMTGGNWERLPGESFAEKFRNYHREHAGKTEEELALLCLPGAHGYSLENTAREFLLERAREKANPELEEFLLAGPGTNGPAGRQGRDYTAAARADMLAEYLFLRGEEARPLAERFADQMAKDGAPADQAERIRNYPFGATAAELLAAMPDGTDQDDATAWRLVRARTRQVPAGEWIGAALERAAATSNVQMRARLGWLAKGAAEGRPADRQMIAGHEDAWKALIEDDRAVAPHHAASVADDYLGLLEMLQSPKGATMVQSDERPWAAVSQAELDVQRLLRDHGRRGREWLRERAHLRLAGTPEDRLPPWPDERSAKADEGLAAEMRGRFAAVASREEAEVLAAGLGLAERAALPEALRADADLHARLQALGGRIEKVRTEGIEGEWGERMRAWEGRAPTRELAEEMRKFAEEMARSGKIATSKLTRKADFGGCELEIKAKAAREPEPGAKGREAGIAGYGGLACGPGLYGAAFWRTAPLAEGSRWWAPKTSDRYDRDNFERALDQYFEAPPPASEETFVAFQTKGDSI